MQVVAKALPVSCVFEGLRMIVAGKALPGSDLAGGGCLCVLFLLLACWYFTRVHRRAERTGLLARYTAESPG